MASRELFGAAAAAAAGAITGSAAEGIITTENADPIAQTREHHEASRIVSAFIVLCRGQTMVRLV